MHWYADARGGEWTASVSPGGEIRLLYRSVDHARGDGHLIREFSFKADTATMFADAVTAAVRAA